MEIPLKQLDIVGFCDPAGGKQQIKKLRPRSAIVALGMDQQARYYVLEARAGRPSSVQLVNDLLEIGEMYPFKVFGIEANAMQALFAELVARDAKRLKKTIPFVPIYQPTRLDKDYRLRTAIQPIISRGRLFLQKHHTELKTEIMNFPLSYQKDLIDALASAIMLSPKRTAITRRSSEAEALAEYLRNSGADPNYIERRVREVMEQSESLIDNQG